ncbi:uncharacterized protein CIMG_01958 [Coccidioides immitis RS]|uniref:DUF7730 domain-containing protein n=1 Tax=Coccidioides immitis (strain RS) TaxID=246410 RepID=J3KKB9_COCIM|nr:uncharacterized protein CIMG_01958 [Coccidioides immitis RS]EAS36604.3 hypothetical protein CIMG_01958 [Coccidioides immitis RS]TPX25302.1 hypothetical protein DIZ76_010753 [Coccidioides immitis]
MHNILKDALSYLSLYGALKNYCRRWKSTVKSHKLRHPLTLPPPESRPLPIYHRKKQQQQQQQQQQQRYQPQTESIFFTLPLEIRRQIYSYAFGGRAVKRPFLVRSVDWHAGGHQHSSHASQQQHVPRRIQWADIIPIALLQTCRQIYTEAIEVFYSDAIFKAFTPVDMNRIFMGVPSQRLDSVRSIWIDIRFAITCSLQCDGLEEVFDERTWAEVVRSFARFPRLRDVRVSFLKDDLTGGDYCAYLLERFVLPSMAAMTDVPKYELMVNFEVESPENAPFRVRRIRAPMLY